jgi:hypothetical protein
MKDKSRFLSSVIVSLLAGFIYYLFGQNITETAVSSVKAVLSSNFTEDIMNSDCITLNSSVKISGNKLIKNKTFRNKKQHSLEFKEIIITLPVENSFSYIGKNSQAKIQRPSPNRNVDFTSELNRLIKKDKSVIEIKPGKEYRVNKSLSNTNNEMADLDLKENSNKKLRKNIEYSQMKYYNKEYKGNGFEYNYVISSVANEPVKNTRSNNSDRTDSDRLKKKCSEYNYNYNYNNEMRNTEKVEKNTKVKTIAPKIEIKINDEEIDIDLQEINVDDSSAEDSM